jgi:ubiquinone/menaquinone biosynthesis C-methylase UbiE
VGSHGRVTGVDLDPQQLAAARAFIQEAGLTNVEILERDAHHTELPRDSFDVVHVRFLLAPSVGMRSECARCWR